MNNHEKHYMLWDGIVKKLRHSKKAGILYINENDIYTLKKDVYENHPSLGGFSKNHPILSGFSYCYACEEASKIKSEKNFNTDYCQCCPIDWGYDIGAIVEGCGAFNSLYRRLLQRIDVGTAIDLATKIRDAEWRDRDE